MRCSACHRPGEVRRQAQRGQVQVQDVRRSFWREVGCRQSAGNRRGGRCRWAPAERAESRSATACSC